jgi:hypothetical protein
MRHTTQCSSRISSAWGDGARRARHGVALLSLATFATPIAASSAQRPPADSSFGALVAQLSETGGYFDSDNIISNELTYLSVDSQLAKLGVRGGVYVGVGPDQNFSYVALIHPSIAFMLDIRRDNMLEHLLFKSLFAVARNRLEYLCLLFGRPVPADIGAWTDRSTGDLLAYLDHTASDPRAAAASRDASNERITGYHVPLDPNDRAVLDRYRAEFVHDGLETRYSSLGRNNRFDYPSFRDLILATDRDGRQVSYLASERAFDVVRDMERDGRIVPVVGNVAGPHAVRAIGAYARSHDMKLSAFYLSNVEQYLMTRQGGFDVYVENLRTLPRDSTSVVIRSYFDHFGQSHPLANPASGSRSVSMIEPIDELLREFDAGEIRDYSDLVYHGYVRP